MNFPISRRAFIKGVGGAYLALNLELKELAMKMASAQGEYYYRDWEDLYRQAWTWDRVVKGTHSHSNCLGGCAFDLYVKDGVVLWEEQSASYPPTNDYLPDFNPRGCQKGACYSSLMYSPTRLKYPLKRAGERGEGKWQRISWQEAMDEVSERIIEAVYTQGPESVFHIHGGNIGYDAHSAAKLRFLDLLGGSIPDNTAELDDLDMGTALTYGLGAVDGSSEDWFNSDCIIIWGCNPVYTRIPEAHFLWEARYNGAQVVSIAPDLNASSIHCDLWLPINIGTDAALGLSMARVIVGEKLYDPSHLKEQTDMPFLVKEEDKRFLREKDMEEGGREDVFYFMDEKSGKPQKAPGSMGSESKTLQLPEGASPALEGVFELTDARGEKIKVRPLFEHLKEALEAYEPQEASKITGIAPSLIEKVARDFARAKSGMILVTYGGCKFYHGDLTTRAKALLCALCGHTGKPGGGVRITTFYPMNGFDLLCWPKSYGQDPNMATPMTMSPAVLFEYFHGGLKEVVSRRDYGDQSLPKSLEEYLEESLQKGWMPLIPPEGVTPKVFIESAGNPLRRIKPYPLLMKHLWPKLSLAVNVNYRLDSTALYSDILLPTAGWYEMKGFKAPHVYLPFVHLGDKAVEPLGEAKPEWEIFALLSKEIQRKARDRDLPPYKDSVKGVERDLKTLYEDYSQGGRFEDTDEDALLRFVLEHSPRTKGITLEELRGKGIARIKESNDYITSALKEGEAITPYQRFVKEKTPWFTLTGRQQFYIDHPWYLEAGEALPTHKDPPRAGGNYPLRLTGGHTRWSIHSIWRDNPLMLRLQRGVPVMYMALEDARKRSIKDHDLVKVYNDLGSFTIHVKVSPSLKPGQVVAYHAWEPAQFEGFKNPSSIIPAPFKPLHLLSDYGHIYFGYGHCAPGQPDRDTCVEVVKA